MLTQLALTAASTKGYHCIGGCVARIADTTFADYHTKGGVPQVAIQQFYVSPDVFSTVQDSVRRALSRRFGSSLDCGGGGPPDFFRIEQWRLGDLTVLLASKYYADKFTVKARAQPFLLIEVMRSPATCQTFYPPPSVR